MKEAPEKVTREKRRRRVAELYPEHSTAALAARFGVSDVTIRNDLRALAIPIVRRRALTAGQRRHAVRLRRQGLSLRAIGAKLGCAPGTLRRYFADRDVPRPPSNRDFGPCGTASGGRLTLGRAASRFGVVQRFLRDAAEANRVRHTRLEGVGSKGVVYLFDERELEEDLAALPTCKYDGCEALVLGPSGGCERHGHALAWRGRHLTTEHKGKISAKTRNVPRPYASARMTSIHRDPKLSAGWYWDRFKSPKGAGRLAKQIAESKGKKVGPEFSSVDAGKAEQILRLARQGRSQRAIEYITGVSRGSIRNVLRDPERVVAHFSLHDLG